ncbi:oxygenase MpaB family protein [Raineya orbicola]|jgi:hypothetical protein|uniref:ER-bound oxygenase mpaB/mpaB'/Rubber oxygenase catalytic domain-containing protein n=1 Tax=Raineya orbicola TaxID=2016530 RepID=A0A2N3IJM2_9BACT|nr:oxygenase MpaB family protein [Raineya orbicola]PKQ70481.1 hypothetical protein Rain11_0401 [Raineya orbicola]
MPKIFDKEFLASQRQETDAYANLWAEVVWKNFSIQEISDLLTWLNGTQNTIPNQMKASLQLYFDEVIFPSWADTAKMQAGARFFHKHRSIILHLLGVLSLPYCYAAKNGVKVLTFSGRLQNDAFKRLQETAIFTIKANSFVTLQSEVWKNEILKIRLLHALVRKFIGQSQKWKTDIWGEPINQEDMAGTNLAFSYIVLRGMRKLDIDFSEKEAENFLHLWNVIGYLMGISEDLLPFSMREAYWLDKQIATTQFQESEEGKKLTKTLIEVFYEHLPARFLADLAVAEMRFLLGNKIANMLEVPQVIWNRNFFTENLTIQINKWLISQQSIKT